MIDQNNPSNGIGYFIQMIRKGGFLVLDTETTGLEQGEICQIGIVSSTGETLLDTLVRPVGHIPPSATAIHGIEDGDVAFAQGWDIIAPRVLDIILGRDVVVYNAVYDRKMMHQSDEAVGREQTAYKELAHFWCAMEAFAQVFGDWNHYFQSYRWKPLSAASAYYALPHFTEHHAIGDCLTTLALCKAIAKDLSLKHHIDDDPPMGTNADADIET